MPLKTPDPRTLVGLATLVVSLGVLYAGVVGKLVGDWATDDNYSHGFLIVPLALYFVWERRARLREVPTRPTAIGLVVVLLSLGVLVAGTLGAELFLTRVSLLGVLAGTALFLWGPGHLRVLAFPLAFLLLMVPIPAIVFNQIAFPLQLLASQFGEAALRAMGIPVLREGNVLVLATTSLEVAEACSGIRSLISLVTLGLVLGYFQSPRWPLPTALALASVPVAVVANGIRVAGTGVAAHYYGAQAAEGFFHDFSGWMVFLTSLALLMAVQRLVARVLPAGPRGPVEQPTG